MEIDTNDLEWGLFAEHPNGPHVVVAITGTRFYIPLLLFTAMVDDVRQMVSSVVAWQDEAEEAAVRH